LLALVNVLPLVIVLIITVRGSPKEWFMFVADVYSDDQYCFNSFQETENQPNIEV